MRKYDFNDYGTVFAEAYIMKVIHVTWQAWQYGIETFLLALLPYQNRCSDNLVADIVFHKTNELGEKKYRKKNSAAVILIASYPHRAKLSRIEASPEPRLT